MYTVWVDSLISEDTKSLLKEQFRLRKRIFIDGLHWQLPTLNELEIDQYDTPAASYCLAVDDHGKLLSSARLLRTDRELGPTTYMIRDTKLGKLEPGLPRALCDGFDAPVCKHTWEATRLTVCPELPKLEKKAALQALVNRMVAEAKRADVHRMIAIGGIELHSGVRMSGFKIKRLTEYKSTSSGNIAVFELPVFHF